MEIILKKIEKLEALLETQNILNKEILTLVETAKYLSCSKSAIYKLTSNKEIPHYIPGGKKIYFKRSEIDSWISSSKVPSVFEYENEIDGHLNGKFKLDL